MNLLCVLARCCRRFGFALLLVTGLAGCATQIIPPGEIHEPAPIYVLEHGSTSSLVLTDTRGRMYRYAYGDWAYYAERQTGSGHALAALFWSTAAGLGRREFPGPPGAESIYRHVRVGIDAVHRVDVDARQLAALHRELEAMFDQATTRLDSPAVDLRFVRHPVPYHLLHNSNHVVADWLIQLGCELSHRPILSGWAVTPRP